MYKQEEKRAIHLMILICYTFMTVALIGESFLLKWDMGVVILLVLGVIASWTAHITEKLSDTIRIWVYFILSMLSFFFYGIHETSMYDMAPLMIVIIILFYSAQITQMINLCMVVYSLTMLYDFVFVVQGKVELSSLTISRTIIHFVFVFIAGYLANFIIKRRRKASMITDNIIAELEETNRRTEDFLANVSHELRTPINAVTGITSVMLNNEKDADKRKDLLSIQTAGQRLFSQIGAILDYTEIDIGRIRVSEETYMISSLINDIVIKSHQSERDSNIELIFDIDADIPSVLIGDEKKIKTILEHLIDNAFKFTKKGGIYVRVFALQKPYGINLCIRVSDTGVGIAEKELEKIKERFYQTNTGRDRKVGGLGLGLSIVYGMVSAMEGFIQIKSTVEKGTTVFISIPQKVSDGTPSMVINNRKELCLVCYLRPEKYEVPEIREYYNEMISHMIQRLDSSLHRVSNMDELEELTSLYQVTHLFIGREEYEEDISYFENLGENAKVIVVADDSYALPQGSKVQILRKPFYGLSIVNILNMEVREDEMILKGKRMICPGIRVLVVDDEPMNLMVAEGIFRDYQMDVTLAESGRRAIELCEKEEFDLVFLDHMMPVMDGVETLKQIRRIHAESGKVFTVIAFTANAVSGAKEMLLQEGFDEFMSKPMEPLELERILRKMLPKSSIMFVDKNNPIAPEDNFVRLEDSGIHSHAGLQYCHGDKKFYIDVLLKFAKDAKQKMKEINEFFEKEDFENYCTKVHALKSTAKMIGADLLSEKAKCLEMAAKNQETDFIRDHHEELLCEYHQVIQCILEVYGSDENSVAQVSMAGKTEISKEEFLGRLVKLEEKLDTYEADESETIISEMSELVYQGESVGKLLLDVSQDVDDFEFSSALEKVETLMRKVEGGEEK